MLLTKVNSSNVYAIGWDRGDIIVQYQGGRTYRYSNGEDNVELFESFAKAESKGKFVNEVLKKNFQYGYVNDSEVEYFKGVVENV